MILEIPGVMPSSQVVAELKADNRPVLLSFSAGKDAVATWLHLRSAGIEVVPFYLYYFPGLEFVEAGLAYYEQFFGQKIHQMPHPSLHRWLNNFVFVAPWQKKIIMEADLPNFTYEDVEQALREDLGLHQETIVCNGVRAADSPNRRSALKSGGSLIRAKRKAMPVWDWKIEKLKTEFLKAEVKLTVDYKLFGRSFDGMDYRFLKPIKEHFPRDYERILEWFPLADIDIFRAEQLWT